MKYQQQIEGIKKKLLSAKKNDKRLKVFGASSHKYKLKKPASEDMLLSFEKEYSIVLPECYRAFLSSIGNGGISYANSAAGPFYGIYPLGRCVDELVETPKQYLKMPVRIEPNMTDEFWGALTERIDNDENISDEEYEEEIAKIFSGLLPIGSQGCTYLHAVVVNGSYKGRIVYLDVDLQKPKFAYEKNFLDWYERWLDEIISGVLISESPTWFGYSRGGDDKQLLDIYYASENPETKIEALSGLLKLNQVCEASCLKLLELCSDGNPEVRHRAVGLLTKFNYPMAVESLRKHINGDDRDCIAACRSIASYAKKMSGKWIDCLKQRLPRLNDEEAFHSLTCLLLESKIDCSDDLKPFCFHKNEEIRVRVFYVFGELKKKSSLVELFLLGLRDPSSRVVHATIQALSGVRDKRLLKAYGNILSRFETDEHYILTNLKLRLNEMGFPTSEVFNKSSEYGKLERENVFRALNKKNKTGGLFKRLFK